MPTYEYHCQNCKTRHTISHKITEEAKTMCPSCQQPSLKRGPGGGVGLSFQGTGFYITDYTNQTASSKESNSSCCPCGKNQCDT